MMNVKALAMAMGMAVAASAVSAATVVIDDFASSQQVISPAGFGIPSSSTVPEANAFGGSRTLTAAGNGSGGFGSVTAVTVSGGSASVGNSPEVVGSGLFEYSSTTSLDFTSGGTNNAVRIGVTNVDLNTRFQLTIDSVTVTKNITSVGPIDFLFSEFSAPANFASVFDVKLKVGGVLASTDTSFTFFGAVDTTPVPLPAGMVLFSLALALLGGLKISRSKA